MDLIASHLPEIKTIGMLALGLFCYHRLKKAYGRSEEQEICDSSDDQCIDPAQHESNQKIQEQCPNESHKQEDKIISKGTSDFQLDGQKALYETSELERQSSLRLDEDSSRQTKKKLIRKRSKNPRRPIIRRKLSNPNSIKQTNSTEVMIV